MILTRITRRFLFSISLYSINCINMSCSGSPNLRLGEFYHRRKKEELDMVEERNPQVKKAVVKLLELSADERARDMSGA